MYLRNIYIHVQMQVTTIPCLIVLKTKNYPTHSCHIPTNDLNYCSEEIGAKNK